MHRCINTVGGATVQPYFCVYESFFSLFLLLHSGLLINHPFDSVMVMVFFLFFFSRSITVAAESDKQVVVERVWLGFSGSFFPPACSMFAHRLAGWLGANGLLFRAVFFFTMMMVMSFLDSAQGYLVHGFITGAALPIDFIVELVYRKSP